MTSTFENVVSGTNINRISTSLDEQGNTLSDEEICENMDELDLLSHHVTHLTPDVVSVGITWYKATFLIVNAALGAGLLNFPLAFHQAGGIAAGNIAHLVFVTFALGSLVILAICASKKKCKTYQEVVINFCGIKWSMVASVCIALYCFVTCITFIIIIGDQFDRAFASFFGSNFCHTWYLNRTFTMTVSSLPLIFPCCLKRIDGMQLMSYIGVLSVWYLVIVIIIEMEGGSYTKGEVLIWDINFPELFNVIPTICFGYQCHVSSVPIYSCLKKSDMSTLIKACASAILICFVVYTIGANCGYLTFGSVVNADVLLSYDARKPHVLGAVLLLAIKSWTTYPILLFCVREAVSDVYIHMRNFSVIESAASEQHRRRVIATCLWMTTILLAVFTPSLNIVIKLLGSLAAVFILVFPGLCLLFNTFDQNEFEGSLMRTKEWLKLLVSVIYISVGVFTFGLAFSLGMEAIIHPATDIPICT